MAEARCRAEWERLAVGVCWVVNSNGVTKKAVRPKDVIPKAFHPPAPPPRKLTPEELEQQSRLAWKVLDRAFGGRH
jgi:hypothetical protein